jgi:hypothetical protein
MVINAGTAWRLFSLGVQVLNGKYTDREQVAIMLHALADEFDPQKPAVAFTATTPMDILSL